MADLVLQGQSLVATEVIGPTKPDLGNDTERVNKTHIYLRFNVTGCSGRGETDNKLNA